jgi:hypothetical protein
LTIQIENAGLASSARAIVGSAMLAMAPSITARMRPSAMVRIAR